MSKLESLAGWVLVTAVGVAGWSIINFFFHACFAPVTAALS
jgi:hypothetical protein